MAQPKMWGSGIASLCLDILCLFYGNIHKDAIFFKKIGKRTEWEVKGMKIKVKHDFKDRENNLKLRTVGEIMTVTKERAEYLTNMKLAEIIDVKGDDSETVVETH